MPGTIPPTLQRTGTSRGCSRLFVDRRTGVKSRPWWLTIVVLAGCPQPRIDARAVWLDGVIAEDGSRVLHAYANGVTTDYRILNPAAATDEQLIVALSPSAEGALVRSLPGGAFDQLGDGDVFRAAYIDFRRHRVLPIQLPTGLTGEQTLDFSPRGDMLAWQGDSPPTLSWIDLEGEAKTDSSGFVPRHEYISDVPFATVFAADTTIFFTVEVSTDGKPVAGGRLAAVRYQADGTSRVLANGRLLDAVPVTPVSAEGCPGRAKHCTLARVDPDGEAITLPGDPDVGCRLQRWSWTHEPDQLPAAEATCVLGASGPLELLEGEMIAAISPVHYVFQTETGWAVYNWETGEVDQRPWITEARLSLHQVQQGRAVVSISGRGPMMRATTDGIDILSVSQANCPDPTTPAVSPAGSWAMWGCGLETIGGAYFIDDATNETFVRVSEAGLEQHQGVPMWVAAIDDDGDALMWSRTTVFVSSETGASQNPPRNLYILGSDQSLARTEALEPDPVLSYSLDRSTRQWIAARPFAETSL